MNERNGAGPCFLVASDEAYRFLDSPQIRTGLGAFLYEIKAPELIGSLLELYKAECPDRSFDLTIVAIKSLSPHELVLAHRQISRAESIGLNLGSEDYCTSDPIFAAIGACAVALGRLEGELQHVVTHSPNSVTLVEGDNGYSSQKHHLPHLARPTTKDEAIERLVFALERHRLLFLYVAGAYRVGASVPGGTFDVYEQVLFSDIEGHEHFQIDEEGQFLFKHRKYLDRYADLAMNRFGSGTPKDVPARGVHPHWRIDDFGVPYLEESATAIRTCLGWMREFDGDGTLAEAVRRTVMLGHDEGKSRWYASAPVRWEYLADLDKVIAEWKRAAVLVEFETSRANDCGTDSSVSYYLSVTTHESIFNHDPPALGYCPEDPHYLPMSSTTDYFFVVGDRGLAERLGRLFNKQVKPVVEQDGETRIRVAFAIRPSTELDEDEIFLANESIEQISTAVEESHMAWRKSKGLRFDVDAPHIVLGGIEWLDEIPPLSGDPLRLERLYDQASRWVEKFTSKSSYSDIAPASAQSGDGQESQPTDRRKQQTPAESSPPSISSSNDQESDERPSDNSGVAVKTATSANAAAPDDNLDSALSFAARSAFGSLVHSFDEAIDLYRRTRRFSNPTPVLDCIERFVHEVTLEREWFAELERRVALVESACGVGSRYFEARLNALASHTSTTKQLCRGKLAIERLRGSSPNSPHYLAEVVEVRKNIRAVLEEPSLGLSAAAIQAFADWEDACRRIQQEAERLEVDGCWYLYYVYRAAEPHASERSREARAILRTSIGGVHLESLRAAAHALAAWTRESGVLQREMMKTVKQSEIATEDLGRESGAEPRQFAGGELIFYADRVELCGADVCSGPRRASRRIVLELLSQQREGRSFVSFSGEDLETEAKKLGAKGTAAGWIRDLRNDIMRSLRDQAGIISDHKDIILSGDSGYRFADCLSVRYADQCGAITDITDIDESEDVRNVPNDDVRDVLDVHEDEAARRRTWIIKQLQAGVQLKAPVVATQFKRSKKTAQRDLDALRDEGSVEFVGDPRTGYYRLHPSYSARQRLC